MHQADASNLQPVSYAAPGILNNTYPYGSIISLQYRSYAALGHFNRPASRPDYSSSSLTSRSAATLFHSAETRLSTKTGGTSVVCSLPHAHLDMTLDPFCCSYFFFFFSNGIRLGVKQGLVAMSEKSLKTSPNKCKISVDSFDLIVVSFVFSLHALLCSPLRLLLKPPFSPFFYYPKRAPASTMCTPLRLLE